MNKSTHATNNDPGTLADDARALMAATAEVAGEKVSDARNRLAIAVDNCQEVLGRIRAKALKRAKSADEAVHEHPYEALGIAFGVGTLIGYLVSRRRSRHAD
jgi:ElaB/YqjD/DUF883 family membrane-anchored ribosome-binding protein